MTDPLRPNPLGLPLEPDPVPPPGGPAEMPGRDDTGRAIDDPVTGPAEQPDHPDERSLDLPGDVPDEVGSGPGLPEPQPA